MNTFSRYVFQETLRPLLVICVFLLALTFLTEGLSSLDIIVTNHRAGWAYLWVTLLALPQDFSLIIPLAMFGAVAFALNRMRAEGEIAVAYAAGVSQRRISRPIIMLATLAALAHLSITTIVQPLASREMRDILYSVRGDVASTLVRESTFTTPAPGVTLYATDRVGGELRNVFIDDRRGRREVTYTARAGSIVTLNGQLALALRSGQAHGMQNDGSVDVLDFDRYVVLLGGPVSEAVQYIVKPSDRTLYELFLPDMTASYEQHNVDRFLAEGNARLASPLLEIAMAMLGIAGVLGGDSQRLGYARRIMAASCIAIGFRLLATIVQTASISHPWLNFAQYALPIVIALCANLMITGVPGSMRREALPLPVRA